MISFLFKNVENSYPKERAIMQIFRVVPQTKRGDQVQTAYRVFFQLSMALK